MGANRKYLQAQSAMEYLMTYGWAILVIALVLGVLYYLGVFSSASLAPRAQPGSCQIFRPNGPGTSYDAALSGTCNDEMPEYVAQFNGQTSYVKTPSLTIGPGSASLSVWVYLSSSPPSPGIVATTGEVPGGFETWVDTALALHFTVRSSSGTTYTIAAPASSINTWYFLVDTFNSSSGVEAIYINGALKNSASGTSLGPNTLDMCFGSYGGYTGSCGGDYLPGSLADIQIYNISLTTNEIQALYIDGIGGPPVRPQNLLGWWPLNGNPNDYSGNQNNGASTAVSYTSSWVSGYTNP